MKPGILTTAEILDLFSPLKDLEKGLDEILAEYQTEERRIPGEELKEYCQPGLMPRIATPYGYIRYDLSEDIDKEMRTIRLEKELVDSKEVNPLIAYWSRDLSLDIY